MALAGEQRVAVIERGYWGLCSDAARRMHLTPALTNLHGSHPSLPIKVLATGEEVKLQRNALVVLEYPTGNEPVSRLPAAWRSWSTPAWPAPAGAGARLTRSSPALPQDFSDEEEEEERQRQLAARQAAEHAAQASSSQLELAGASRAAGWLAPGGPPARAPRAPPTANPHPIHPPAHFAIHPLSCPTAPRQRRPPRPAIEDSGVRRLVCSSSGGRSGQPRPNLGKLDTAALKRYRAFYGLVSMRRGMLGGVFSAHGVWNLATVPAASHLPRPAGPPTPPCRSRPTPRSPTSRMRTWCTQWRSILAVRWCVWGQVQEGAPRPQPAVPAAARPPV